MDTIKTHFQYEIQEIRQNPIEIPCKDLDMDCLPDEEGHIPFGDYTCCYLYDKEQGMCPFLPFRKVKGVGNEDFRSLLQ